MPRRARGSGWTWHSGGRAWALGDAGAAWTRVRLPQRLPPTPLPPLPRSSSSSSRAALPQALRWARRRATVAWPSPRVWETQVAAVPRARQCPWRQGAQLPGLSPAGMEAQERKLGGVALPTLWRGLLPATRTSLLPDTLSSRVTVLLRCLLTCSFSSALEAPHGAPELLFLLNFPS